MNTQTLTAELWLPRPRGEVFAFFADARNLESITPPALHFTILTPGPITMKAGVLIDYRLRLHGMPLRWQSEITTWDPPTSFVDTQRRGPYRQWVHTHTFIERDGGTLCRDAVEYAVPGGRLVERLFVRRSLDAIFRYRRDQLTRLLGTTCAHNVPVYRSVHTGWTESR